MRADHRNTLFMLAIYFLLLAIAIKLEVSALWVGIAGFLLLVTEYKIWGAMTMFGAIIILVWFFVVEH